MSRARFVEQRGPHYLRGVLRDAVDSMVESYHFPAPAARVRHGEWAPANLDLVSSREIERLEAIIAEKPVRAVVIFDQAPAGDAGYRLLDAFAIGEQGIVGERFEVYLEDRRYIAVACASLEPSPRALELQGLIRESFARREA